MLQRIGAKKLEWKAKYRVELQDYTPRKNTFSKEPPFIQTAGNCWAFRYMNNLFFNTGIKVDYVKFLKFIESMGVDEETANDPEMGALILCEFLKDKGLRLYRFTPLTNPNLFVKLLGANYALAYSRECGKLFLADVADDDEVDNSFSRVSPDQHATNIVLQNKKLVEKGTRGKANPFNEFSYKDSNVFLESIRRGGIRPVFYFIDYK